MEPTTERFIEAVKAVSERGESVRSICDTCGIDRRNMMRMFKDAENKQPRPQWLASLCEHYRVSADYLLLGRGEVFNG